MQKIDITIARLRLLLADVTAKEQQYTGVRQQFRDQLRRAVERSIYGDASLESILGMMAEIQQRIADAEGTLRDLGLVRARAERELESLQLTKRMRPRRRSFRSSPPASANWRRPGHSAPMARARRADPAPAPADQRSERAGGPDARQALTSAAATSSETRPSEMPTNGQWSATLGVPGL